MKMEKLSAEEKLNARLLVDGNTPDGKIHVSYEGQAEDLLNLAIFGLAELTANIIKAGDATQSESRKLIKDIQERLPLIVTAILSEQT